MWYKAENEDSVFTPSLLVYPDRIEENLRRMIDLAGSADRLRPHVKTHKMGELIDLQLQLGIHKFKCATLSEARMVAEHGGPDVLLAYPLLGPDIPYFLKLIQIFPDTRFSVTVDSVKACHMIEEHLSGSPGPLELFVDLDNGMHRTGIRAEEALDLIRHIQENILLEFAGLHIYDGHIHDRDPDDRKAHCDSDFQEVEQLIGKLESNGIPVGELACGGTPTFPIHAQHPSRTLCPGTPVLWDAGYHEAFPDLDFLPSAVLAGRVISIADKQLSVDLGYKAMASEMAHPRLRFLNLEHKEILNHSEEHLVLANADTHNLEVGDLVYALPVHICPTVALHEQVYVLKDHKVANVWKVAARKRIYKAFTR